MNTPIILAISALFLGGLMKFFWQMGMENGVDIPSFFVVDALFMFLCALVLIVVQKQQFTLSPRMAIVAALGGIFGAASIITIMRAIKSGGAGSIVYPIVSLETAVAVILAFLVFREPMTVTRIVGLGLGVSSIIVLSR